MQKFDFDWWLDFILPRQNLFWSDIHTYFPEPEQKKFSSRYKFLDDDQKVFLQKVLICGDYENFFLKDLIHRAKFTNEWKIGDDLATFMWRSKSFLPYPNAILSVPPDPKRFLMRNYHLPEILAKNLAKLSQKPYLDLLQKKFSTRPQTDLNREERLKNLVDKFEIKEGNKKDFPEFGTIWLVDDLITTGATLVECAKVLKKHFPNCKIYGIVVGSN